MERFFNNVGNLPAELRLDALADAVAWHASGGFLHAGASCRAVTAGGIDIDGTVGEAAEILARHALAACPCIGRAGADLHAAWDVAAATARSLNGVIERLTTTNPIVVAMDASTAHELYRIAPNWRTVARRALDSARARRNEVSGLELPRGTVAGRLLEAAGQPADSVAVIEGSWVPWSAFTALLCADRLRYDDRVAVMTLNAAAVAGNQQITLVGFGDAGVSSTTDLDAYLQTLQRLIADGCTVPDAVTGAALVT